VNSGQERERLSLVMPASHNSIGLAVSNLTRFLKYHRVNERSSTQATIVLRELLVNAITHGSKSNAASHIQVTVERLSRLDFRLTVEDKGPGFNYAAIDARIPENPKVIRNRGYALIKAFTSRCEFNQKGNCITAYFSVEPDSKEPIESTSPSLALPPLQ